MEEIPARCRSRTARYTEFLTGYLRGSEWPGTSITLDTYFFGPVT